MLLWEANHQTGGQLMINRLKTALLLLTFSTLASTSLIAKDIGDFVSELPAIGLISDEVSFDGITLSNLRFEDSAEDDTDVIGKKYVITEPGTVHFVTTDYRLESEVVEDLKLHHFTYGLDKDGPQGCFLHSLGALDRDGTTTFKLVAPKKKGVYSLRFNHASGYELCKKAQAAWRKGDGANANTIMGIMVVK